MPIYLLGSRTTSVEIPNQALSVSISGSVDGVALYVGSGGAEQHVIRVNPHVVIIPLITESGLTVGVEPVGVATFGHDTIVHLVIGPDSPGEFDPQQVCFDPVNLSGTPGMELAALTPHGGRIEVTTRAIVDSPLSPLASMARTAARRRAGKDQQPRGGSLTIGVDASASMKDAFDDGSICAAIDMTVGVADAAGIRDIAAALVGARCTPVHASVAELAMAVTSAPVRWSAGARWSQLPDSKRTIVVTDSLNFAVADRFPAVHVSDDARLRTSGPLLAPPPAGVAAENHLGENPGLVDDIADALLRILT